MASPSMAACGEVVPRRCKCVGIFRRHALVTDSHSCRSVNRRRLAISQVQIGPRCAFAHANRFADATLLNCRLSSQTRAGGVAGIWPSADQTRRLHNPDLPSDIWPAPADLGQVGAIFCPGPPIELMVPCLMTCSNTIHLEPKRLATTPSRSDVHCPSSR
jgi:hypothetical protein